MATSRRTGGLRAFVDYACVSSYPEHHYGNLFEDVSLVELLATSSSREAMLARPVQLVAAAPCQTCEYLAVCHGSCAIRALTASGQLSGPDPYCDSYRLLFALLMPPKSLELDLTVFDTARDAAFRFGLFSKVTPHVRL